MAEKRIGRRITQTECTCKVIGDDGTLQDVHVSVQGKLSLDRAQNAARKKLGNNKLLVESIEYDSFYCSMSVEDFIKYGEHKD